MPASIFIVIFSSVFDGSAVLSPWFAFWCSHGPQYDLASKEWKKFASDLYTFIAWVKHYLIHTLCL